MGSCYPFGFLLWWLLLFLMLFMDNHHFFAYKLHSAYQTQCYNSCKSMLSIFLLLTRTHQATFFCFFTYFTMSYDLCSESHLVSFFSFSFNLWTSLFFQNHTPLNLAKIGLMITLFVLSEHGWIDPLTHSRGALDPTKLNYSWTRYILSHY